MPEVAGDPGPHVMVWEMARTCGRALLGHPRSRPVLAALGLSAPAPDRGDPAAVCDLLVVGGGRPTLDDDPKSIEETRKYLEDSERLSSTSHNKLDDGAVCQAPQ